MTAKWRLLVGVGVLAAATAGVGWLVTRRSDAPRVRAPDADRDRVRDAAMAANGPLSTEPTFSFHMPTGEASMLSCADARALVRQARARLAYPAPAVASAALSSAAADWLDPHGLWSASPDSPVPAAFDRQAAALVRDLESDSAGPCSAARAVGDVLVRWVGELRIHYGAARVRARGEARARSDDLDDPAADPILESDSPREARTLAEILGARVGGAERVFGEPIAPYTDAAASRFFPELDGEGWSKVVLAAAVRAYVPLMDPHGAWAALDEEASVYDVDLEAHPPDRLWGKASRTALGILVESDPLAPLQVGDVVLAIAGVATAGLPPEQIEQLAYAVTDTPAPAPLVLVRRGEHALRSLELPAPPEGEPDESATDLPSYRVDCGGTDALVVEIHDVRSDLAEELDATLAHQEAAEARGIGGILLDLRDNGGGSTEGAIAALGMFLPGAPLFPMARRDGAIEVDRAPLPPTDGRWPGPVATLVDGDTASAAEMIAGALAAYHRGPVVGSRTYGKGCAQEYLDDEPHRGVLRLTTLLYALPDGSPVQGVGIEPSFLLPSSGSEPGEGPHEREADMPQAPPTWRGPDVRDPTLVRAWGAADGMSWPSAGPVGQCRDPEVCQALRALALPLKRPTAVKGR